MLASLVEELPIVIWPLVGFKKWHKDARGERMPEGQVSGISLSNSFEEER